MSDSSVPLDRQRVERLKVSYTVRQVPLNALAGLSRSGVPMVGDVVVARIVEFGHHERLESPDGRRQSLYIGDEILVCYGNRYAPSQFEAIVPTSIGPCHLVAAGGLVAEVTCQHVDTDRPTQVEVLGFAIDHSGRRINLSDHPVAQLSNGPTDPRGAAGRPFTVVVVGTSMDSGKTTTAAGIIKGLIARGLTVGAAKVTGTGAGGDVWAMSDAGASPVVDFTDVGLASTYLAPLDLIEGCLATLSSYLGASGVEVSVIEIADGIFQAETHALLASPVFAARCDRLVFAAGDAAGAVEGVARLRRLGHEVAAVSGKLTASPLAIREANAVLDVPVLDLERLHLGDHDLVPRHAAPTQPHDAQAASLLTSAQ